MKKHRRRFGIIGPRKSLRDSHIMHNKAACVVISVAAGALTGGAVAGIAGSNIGVGVATGALSSGVASVQQSSPALMLGYDSKIHDAVKHVASPPQRDYKGEIKERIGKMRPLHEDYPAPLHATNFENDARNYGLQDLFPTIGNTIYYAKIPDAEVKDASAFWHRYKSDILEVWCHKRRTREETTIFLQGLEPRIRDCLVKRHTRYEEAQKDNPLYKAIHGMDKGIFEPMSWVSNHFMIASLCAKVALGKRDEAIEAAVGWGLTEAILIAILRLAGRASILIQLLFVSDPLYIPYYKEA